MTDMTDPEIQRADDALVPYVEPEGLGRPEGRTVRQRPNTSVIESYLIQQHTWRKGGGSVVTRASAERPPTPEEIETAAPADQWMVTAWNPLGNGRSLSENEVLNEQLRSEVLQEGASLEGVVATSPPDRSWVEDTLVVTGIREEAIIEIARDYWQPAITALSPTTLSIVPTGILPGLRGGIALREDVVSSPTCPMRIDDEPDALCTMRGGPWVSASIHAALLWKVHQGLLLSRLGCGPCADGSRPTLGPLAKTGGPIAIRPDDLELASRFGGYVWC